MSEDKQYTLKELQNDLTEKKKIFCHEYIIEWNGSKSYKKAYPNVTDETARVNASKLLTNTNINQYIDFIKNDYEKECGITKTKQLNELYKIAYSTIAHLHNTWIELKEFEALTEEQKASIESIDTKTEQRYKNVDGVDEKVLVSVEYVKIKLYSKTQALDMINKMLGYNAPDKIEQKNITYNASVTKEEAKDISEALDNEC